MVRIHFVQSYFNLSDRELGYGLRYNLVYKQFVGIPANYYSFDHSSREDFDSRIPVEIHKAIFFHILAQIKDLGLIGSDEQGITRLTYALRRAARNWTDVVDRELQLTDITDERLHYRAAEEKKLQYFSRLVVSAFGLLARVDNRLKRDILTPKYSAEVQEKAAILRRILEENTELESQDPLCEEVKCRQKPKEDKPKNPLASAVDPDARHSAKSDNKHSMGHKTQNLITAESQFIVNIEGTSATESDGEALWEIADEARDQTELSPPKLLADGQYTTVANLQGAQEPAQPKGGYPLSSFHYDPVPQTLTCPAGVMSSEVYRNGTTNTTMFRFPVEACCACPMKEKCTKNDKWRTVSISDGYPLVLEVKEYIRTAEGKAELKLRPMIERVNGVLKNRFGLNVTKSWGTPKYKVQGYWAGIAYNISRAVKLLHERQQQSAVGCAA